MASRSVRSGSEADTLALGTALGRELRSTDVVLLRGDLGMGKTVLARGFAVGLGVPEQEVRSPTFTLINVYQGRLPVYHVDLYRIDRQAELEELGLEEILGAEGVAIVEWAERLARYRPDHFMELTITDRGGTCRDIEIVDMRA